MNISQKEKELILARLEVYPPNCIFLLERIAKTFLETK